MQHSSSSSDKTILVVARHFPPEISGGSRRPFLFADGLAKLGHTVWILVPGYSQALTTHVTARRPFYCGPLESFRELLKQAPQIQNDVIESREAPFYAKIITEVHRRVVLPDPERGWAEAAASTVIEHQADFRPDIVYTTSPPESCHVAGQKLAVRWSCRWIADFRDSWLEHPLMDLRQSHRRRQVETRFAKNLLKSCDLALVTTSTDKREIEGYAPHLRVEIVPQAVESLPQSQSSPIPGRIIHAGRFSLSDPNGRDLRAALDAFTAARLKVPHITLELIGALSSDEALAASRTEGVIITGELPRDQVLDRLQTAEILLLVVRPGSTAVPGKFYEYVAARRPVLALGAGPWMREVGVVSLPKVPSAALVAMIKGDRDYSISTALTTPTEVAQHVLDALSISDCGVQTGGPNT